MKNVLFYVKKNIIFFSSFFLAIYSVLFLYSKNEPEYRPEVLIIPIVISVLFTTVIFFLFKLVLKTLDKTGIATAVFVFICLSYGRFLESNSSFPTSTQKPPSNYTLIYALTTVIFFVLFFVLLKTKKNLSKINKAILIGSLFLILFPLYSIISYEVKTGRVMKPIGKTDKKMTIKHQPFDGEKPDVYYIILDRYDGQKSLLEQLNFDNSKFLNFLRGKGFYVASRSTTNFPKTFLSFATSLNMEYPFALTKQTNGGESSDQSIATPLIRNNKIVEFLKARGYKYFQVGSWWQPTTTNPNADISYYPPKKGYPYADEFTTGFLNTTIAAPIFQILFHDPVDASSDPQNNIHRQAAIYEFEILKKIPEEEGPKFVFAHILLPHDPFVFDQNCNPIPETVVSKKKHQENYVNQLICTNKKIQDVIEAILSKSEIKPIIILQADEGTFPMNDPLPPKQAWGKASDTALAEKYPILNAYYFPDNKTEALYDTITPVNSFRVVFNTYFDQNLPLLPDRNYVFEDEDNYYKFIEVTNRIER